VEGTVGVAVAAVGEVIEAAAVANQGSVPLMISIVAADEVFLVFAARQQSTSNVRINPLPLAVWKSLDSAMTNVPSLTVAIIDHRMTSKIVRRANGLLHRKNDAAKVSLLSASANDAMMSLQLKRKRTIALRPLFL
jgi:hypothetical protein